MCAHWAILHWTTHIFLCCVYKNILDISVSSEYLFWEGDSLSQFNERPAPTTKKHHSDSSFDGDQRKHDLAASSSILLFLDPWVQSLTLSFQSTRIPKENFLHSKEIPLRCSVSTWLCQISTVSLHSFSEHACNIIPDISVSLEYFISVGEWSYFVISPVGGQLHQPIHMPSKQYFTQSISFILYTIMELFWTFLSLQNILHHRGNKSLFTWRVFLPPKVKLVRFKQLCIILLSSFLYTLLEQIRRYLPLHIILFLQGTSHIH